MTRTASYSRGLHELGDGLHAFLQPDGGWGWSNAGLIVADGASLLVDTLFDLTLTAEMLEAMAPHLARSPLTVAFNTHGNGDHCYGNRLLPEGISIIASAAADEEIRAVPPAAAQQLFKETDLGPEFAAFSAEAFGPFEFAGNELRPPTETFETERAVTARSVSNVSGQRTPPATRSPGCRMLGRCSPGTSCSSGGRR
jgi:cyclase